ncbi:uncharacterized protein LOC108041545 [Drosophila rhopaloa]|uniref:Uncharacterized protein LOC108041545 n=1 Tax=Drosophila rhopaloa TaxID=1041015 RepID=A0A6P4ENT8_DRORH|nr:uncharacterized protein LOC108041545 [Drosophila rhopaloa]
MEYSMDDSLDPTEVGFLEAKAELVVGLSELPKEFYSYGGGRRTAKKRKVEESPATKICDMLGNFLEQQQRAPLPLHQGEYMHTGNQYYILFLWNVLLKSSRR